jgi:hypothetical protein
MSIGLISIGIIVMGCAAVLHEVVRRRRRLVWTLAFWTGFSIATSGIFIAEPAPRLGRTEAGGTSQHSKADRLDEPRFTVRTEAKT